MHIKAVVYYIELLYGTSPSEKAVKKKMILKFSEYYIKELLLISMPIRNTFFKSVIPSHITSVPNFRVILF